MKTFEALNVNVVVFLMNNTEGSGTMIAIDVHYVTSGEHPICSSTTANLILLCVPTTATTTHDTMTNWPSAPFGFWHRWLVCEVASAFRFTVGTVCQLISVLISVVGLTAQVV